MAQARQHPAVKLAGSQAGAARSKLRWPLLLGGVVGAVLVADALFLMALGVFTLGVTLPFGLGCGLVWLSLRWDGFQGWLSAGGARRRLLWRVTVLLAALWLCSVAAFWAYLASTSGGTAATGQPPAVILVLGSGTPNGKASPVLAARLDTALGQARRFPDAVVVVSGGIDFNEDVSEGQIMGDYLRERGLPAARILQEEQSRSTEQNMVLSKPLLRQRGLAEAAPVQIVTSDFHTLRASWIARRAGYADVSAVGSPTPLYVRYNAWLREYFAVISGFLLGEF